MRRTPGCEVVDVFAAPRWLPSLFNRRAHNVDGKLTIYNALSGKIIQIAPKDEPSAVGMLTFGTDVEPTCGVAATLCEAGCLVPATTDEIALLGHRWSERNAGRRVIRQLVWMQRRIGAQVIRLRQEVREGIVNFVAQNSDPRSLIVIGFLGCGDSLTAWADAMELAADVRSVASVDTPLLVSAQRVLGAMDGRTMEEAAAAGVWALEVDATGLLHGNGADELFEKIRDVMATPYPVSVILRLDYTHRELVAAREVVARVGEVAGRDRRFTVAPHSVGKWTGRSGLCALGGSVDAFVDMHLASLQAGLDPRSMLNALGPFASMCHAADPNSMVVDVAGSLHKCTQAMDESYNRVGQLDRSGQASWHESHLSKWVFPAGLSASPCRECFFVPSCLGNACPLYRIETGRTPCPDIKEGVPRLLASMALEKRDNSPTGCAHTVVNTCGTNPGAFVVPRHTVASTRRVGY